MVINNDKIRTIEIIRARLSTRLLALVSVLVLLGLLMSHEMSTWRKFDWQVFYNNAGSVSIWRSVGAVLIMYVGYLLRAIRWSVFLRPVKDVSPVRLVGPTIIGFTGLALLGRPGELVRPFLVARKEDLSVSSQIAVLTLERIFDTTAAGALIAAAILSSSELQVLPYLRQFRRGGALLITLMAVLAMFVFLVASKAEKLGSVLKRSLSPISTGLARSAAEMTNTFGTNLKIIGAANSMIQIGILSISIWLLIALAFLETIHAFSGLRHISLAATFLLLGFSLLGSLVQLPGGGTQQLIVIAALVHVFGVSAELAVSCSILGWLTLFMAPVPVGLALLRHEQLSLRSLSRTSRQPQAA